MRSPFLELLECPFCGHPLRVVKNRALRYEDDRVQEGVLTCTCSAYPVVGGIPLLRGDDSTRAVLRALEDQGAEAALLLMLGLPPEKWEVGRELVREREAHTFLEASELLGANGEGTYFAYRFGDPTYLVTEALIETLGTALSGHRRSLDICGGAGHLTWTLAQMSARAGAPPPVLADFHPWKLWLAQRFVVPEADVVCCDANTPLPFSAAAFSLALCSDAFHYIWARRLFAGELCRLVGRHGVVILAHLHNAYEYNPSAGMPLTPEGYLRLFGALPAQAFGERRLRADILEGRGLDLSPSADATIVNGEPALTMVATARQDLFHHYDRVDRRTVKGELRLNPLYRASNEGRRAVFTLALPSREYEMEFGACREYLPDLVDFDVEEVADLSALSLRRPDLLERKVIIDVPPHYF